MEQGRGVAGRNWVYVAGGCADDGGQPPRKWKERNVGTVYMQRSTIAVRKSARYQNHTRWSAEKTVLVVNIVAPNVSGISGSQHPNGSMSHAFFSREIVCTGTPSV